MSWFLIVCVLLLLMICTNMPVALAIGSSALLVLIIVGVPMTIVPLSIFSSMLSFTLLAIPLFMFLGAILEKVGIADVMVDFATSLVGWLKGGLAMINVVVSMFFAGMSGSSASDVSCIGSILIPQMKRKGYPADFSVAITSFSSTAAIIIPPSISMIVYGVLANVSIVKLFAAGIVPGLILGFGQMVMCYFFARKYNYPVDEDFEWRKLGQRFIKAAPAFTIPVIIMGGILGGVFTITESAAAAAVTAVVLSLTVYRKLTVKKFIDALIVTARRTSIIMLIFGTAGLLGWFIANQQVAENMTQAMLSFTNNPYVILAMINVFLAIIGCFLSGGAPLIILTPILLPLVTSMGIDPLHFGIIMVLNLDMATQTPPVGGTMLLACVVGNARIEEVFRVNKYFLILGFGVVFLVTYVPILCLYLPSFMK